MTYSLLAGLAAEAAESNWPMQEAEGFVKSALDGLTAHIAILNEAGVILHVNGAWQRFAEENDFNDTRCGIGMNYLKVCDAAARTSEDAGLVAQGIREVAQRHAAEFHLEYPCHSPTERRWYIVRVTRFQWYGHIRIIVAHQNVSDIKRVQIELENSQRRLQAILDNLVDGVITFDEHGVIESLNPAGAIIFGYDSDEIIGQNIRLLVPELAHDSDGSVASFIEKVSGLGDEIEGRRQDGSLCPMYFAVSQLNLDHRLLFTGVIQDFTERKYLEAQLWDKERLNIALDKERELRDLKNRFISMMSHELRTPLSAIQLANSMLKLYGDRATEAEKRESIETIEAQVEHLAELIQDVMTISRTDFTGTKFTPEVVDLETYCRDVIERVQLTHRMRCCIEFIGLDRRVEAEIDRKLLHRALSNLLNNAIKYSPEGSSVGLELVIEGQEAVIRIHDQGIGIPEADVKRLFEPFHRAANVGKIQGTGLGLAIARQAIELHRGAISVESQVGAGTTFIVRLPLKHESGL